VHHLIWVEPRVEAQRAVDTALLSSIAVDHRGRKFTNCTTLEFSYAIRGDGATHTDEPVRGDWDTLQGYVKSEAGRELIGLRHRFDQEAAVVWGSALKPAQQLGADELEILQHNNFGICDQVRVRAKDEGLARVVAYYEGFERTVESEKAEVASYEPLGT